jgi:hypothetical protein
MNYSNKLRRRESESSQTRKNSQLVQAFSDNRTSTVAQLKQQQQMHAIQQFATKANNTGLPGNLKSGIENLSGYSMDDVKVHYNSDKPAQLNAHAYAQGADIHIAPGQEHHLPHEAWHVVQQKQGRVQPTLQMKTGIPVNDDAGLEHEADVMGSRANAFIGGPIQQFAQEKSPTKSYQLKTVYQLAPTAISYGNLQEFKFKGVTGYAGSSMSAHLNPAEAKRGSDTGSSTAYTSLFKKLQTSTGTSWVRGHLLNHDLGGEAHYNNLFPITTAANNEHKYEVEYPVKHWLANGCEIDYSVTARKTNSGDSDADGVFECNAQVTSGATKYQGKRVQKNIQSKTQKVTSDKQYRNKSKQSRNGFVQVDYGSSNNILRDDYKTHGATKGWEHTDGNTSNNYFMHNNEIFSSEDVSSTSDVTEIEQEYQTLVLEFLSEYEILGKKLDADLVNDIVEFVQSEANDYEEAIKLFKDELEDSGYTLKKK